MKKWFELDLIITEFNFKSEEYWKCVKGQINFLLGQAQHMLFAPSNCNERAPDVANIGWGHISIRLACKTLWKVKTISEMKYRMCAPLCCLRFDLSDKLKDKFD